MCWLNLEALIVPTSLCSYKSALAAWIPLKEFKTKLNMPQGINPMERYEQGIHSNPFIEDDVAVVTGRSLVLSQTLSIPNCCSVLNPGWMSEWTLVMTLSGHRWFQTCFRNILLLLFITVFQFRTEWTEALQISVSPASGQMGHIRPECTGKGMKTSQRHLELPHLSLTDAGGEPVHIWDNPGCLTFPPMSPQRGEGPDALERNLFLGHGTGKTASSLSIWEHETSR